MNFNLLILAITISIVQSFHVRKPSTCTFPFTYKGKQFDECTNLDSKSYWCSTTELYNGTISLCQVEDLITDDDFLNLMTKASKHVERLSQLKLTISSTENKCTGCIQLLKTVSQSVAEQTAIFMDQNKRLQGLSAQHKQLEEVIFTLKKYYQMRRCRQTDQGADYLGNVFTTGLGNQCQSWSSSSYNENDQFGDNDVTLAKNFCRNPSIHTNPWCYTDIKANKWDNCHIPKCDVDCRIDERSSSSLHMCDRYPSAKCPAGSHYFENSCYFQHTEKLNYAKALQTCLNSNGNLASIHSDNENRFIASRVYPGEETFFVGLNDRVKENNFVWTDGTPFNYKRFYTGEPNGESEDCIELGRYPSQREAWNDVDCEKNMGFVCKIPISRI